jgi:hypothetical protein
VPRCLYGFKLYLVHASSSYAPVSCDSLYAPQLPAFQCAPGSESLLCSECSDGWFHDGALPPGGPGGALNLNSIAVALFKLCFAFITCSLRVPTHCSVWHCVLSSSRATGSGICHAESESMLVLSHSYAPGPAPELEPTERGWRAMLYLAASHLCVAVVEWR